MARIVNVSKVSIARDRTDPNASTASSLITDIQGNAALTSDLASAGQAHEGSGTGCPLGLPYSCLNVPLRTSSPGTIAPAQAMTIVQVPVGEPFMDIALAMAPSSSFRATIYDTSWTEIDQAEMVPIGDLHRARLAVTAGTRIVLIEGEGLISAGPDSITLAFPGLDLPSVTTGEDDQVTVPASFSDIDQAFASAGQGWSGFHATAIDQNLSYLEEFISGAPAYPTENLVLSTFCAPSPGTVPIGMQFFGWIALDQSGPGTVWDAPGANASPGSMVTVASSVVACSQSTNLVMRVLIATQDKTFGTSTVVTAQAQVFDEGLALVSTTAAGAWSKVGAKDLYQCSIPISSCDVGLNAITLRFNVSALSPALDPNAFRLLGIGLAHEN